MPIRHNFIIMHVNFTTFIACLLVKQKSHLVFTCEICYIHESQSYHLAALCLGRRQHLEGLQISNSALQPNHTMCAAARTRHTDSSASHPIQFWSYSWIDGFYPPVHHKSCSTRFLSLSGSLLKPLVSYVGSPISGPFCNSISFQSSTPLPFTMLTTRVPSFLTKFLT